MTSRHVLVLSGGLSPERDVLFVPAVASPTAEIFDRTGTSPRPTSMPHCCPTCNRTVQTASCPCCTAPPVRTVRCETFSKPSTSTTWAPTRRGSFGVRQTSRLHACLRDRGCRPGTHRHAAIDIPGAGRTGGLAASETASVFPSWSSPRVVVVHSASRSCDTVRIFPAMVSAFAYGRRS